ncbi:MAG: PD-(D/E)XK nuclease family protein, partial [Gammaproteobacteria bacterium]
CPGLASLFSLFDHGRRQRGRREPSAWADLFQQQLDAADWPTRAESAAQRQVIKIWKAALANLRALAPQYPSMDLEQALRTIQLLCGMITTTDRFDAAVQVTLASPEECFGLQFEAIWVLDTDDKQWPEAARPNPLLPYSLQYEARMPRSSADWQHQEARRQFQGLKDATREQLLFSYCETEEEQQLRPSPLLHGLTVAQLASADLPAISLDMTTITDCQNLPLAPGESIKGGTSLLSDQSQCPFRSFARHRLHTEALREFSSGPDSADRGSMLHTALKVVWDQLQGSDALQRLSEADLEQLLQHACTVATDELRGKYPETVTPVYSDLEQIRLRRLLVAQLELDRQRPPFTTPYREHELTWHGPGFELNLKADRIDRLANGSYFLVDYKSGRSAINTRHWQGERPEDMQLALYHSSMVAATITPVAGAAMLQLHAEQQQYYGAIDTDEAGWLKPVRPREDWQALAAAWPQNVTRLAGEFSDGVNRVEPLDPVRTCTYCDFHSLCRIQENSAVFEAESPEGSPQDD